jgi:arginase family enzyme
MKIETQFDHSFRYGLEVFFFPFALFGNPGAAESIEVASQILSDRLDLHRSANTRLKMSAARARYSEFVFGDTEEYARWQDVPRNFLRRSLKRSRLSVVFSANHLGVLPVYKHLPGIRPGSKTAVLLLDAHLDEYRFPDAEEKLNHGNFLLSIPAGLDVIAFGDRDPVFGDTQSITRRWSSSVIARRGFDACADEVLETLQEYDVVHVDFDFDVLDPAFFPATSTPVACGLYPREAILLLERLPWERIRTLDFCEYLHTADQGGISQCFLEHLFDFLLETVHRLEEGEGESSSWRGNQIAEVP